MTEPTGEVDTSLLCEMMVCPNCKALGDDIREVDNLTCTWMCLACGWTADGRDFDPGFDDRIDELMARSQEPGATIAVVDISVPCDHCHGRPRDLPWQDRPCIGCEGTGRRAPADHTGGWYADVTDQDNRLIYRTPEYMAPEPAEADAIGWTYVQNFDVDYQRWAKVDPTVFVIPNVNMDKLISRLDKMNRTADRLDVPQIKMAELGRLVVERATSEADRIKGNKRPIKCTAVSINGAPIVIDDSWTFVGTLEHSDAGNVLRAVPGLAIPDAYRDVEPQCDHCKLDRRRNDTYIVVDNDDHYLQVGKSCLRNYLGHRSPHKIAAFYESLAELGSDLANEEYFIDAGPSGYGTITFLGFVVGAIRLWGWTSRSKAGEYGRATVDDARSWLLESEKYDLPNNQYRDRRGRIVHTRNGHLVETTEDDWAMARAAVEWIRSLDPDDLDNDYMWNLSVVAADDLVTFRRLGLIASLIPAYQRHLAKTIERLDAPESNWVGTLKKRQEWNNLTLTDIISWEGFYGVTFLHKFQDPDGNVLVWKTGSALASEPGSIYQGKATVKAHDTYKDVKQTVLTRCAFSVQE